MVAELTDRIREIADARGVSESAVLEQAVERGLQEIWEETILSRYVAGDLDRSEAVEHVGERAVQRAGREVKAVEQDVEWGTKADFQTSPSSTPVRSFIWHRSARRRTNPGS